MSRHICLALAASLSLAVCNLANCQDAQTNAPVTSPTDSSTPDVAKLQAENAALKKAVADARRTIATLQAELAKAGIRSQTATTNSSDASAVTDTSAPEATPAAPSGPLKALPLDATNANVNPAAPGSPAADAGPSKTYTVVKGDKLWTIAKKMYPGHTKEGVDKIQEANKDALGNKPLKIGQVLIIPQ